MPWSSEIADLFAPNAAPIKLIRYASDGRYVATADVRRMVRVWDGQRLVLERRYRSSWDRLRAIDHVRDIQFDAADQNLLVAAGDRVRCVNLQTRDERQASSRKPTFGFLVTCPQAIAISPLNELAIAYDDGVIEVLSANGRGFHAASTWQDNDGPCMLEYAPGGRLVGSDRYSVCVWDPSLGVKLGKLTAEKVYGLAVSPAAPVVAVRNLRRVAIWNIDTGDLMSEAATLPGLPTLAFSVDGTLFAVGDAKGATVYDLEGVTLNRLDSPSPVLALRFSPVEPRLAVGFADGKLAFWDYSKKPIRHVL